MGMGMGEGWRGEDTRILPSSTPKNTHIHTHTKKKKQHNNNIFFLLLIIYFQINFLNAPSPTKSACAKTTQIEKYTGGKGSGLEIEKYAGGKENGLEIEKY